jgi:hypothetical protein
LALCSKTGTYDLAAALETNDLIPMVKVPAGATVIDVILDVPDLDSGTDVLMSVGYTGALTAFISSSTVAQAGGIVRTSVAGGTAILFSAEDMVQLTVTTGPTTETTGTISLTVLYTMDP